MFRKLAIVLLLIGFAGCGFTGKTKETLAVVTGYEREPSGFSGCLGTDWKTHIKTSDRHVDVLCGKVAAVGDTIAGWWTEGHWDANSNGFRRTN